MVRMILWSFGNLKRLHRLCGEKCGCGLLLVELCHTQMETDVPCDQKLSKCSAGQTVWQKDLGLLLLHAIAMLHIVSFCSAP